MSVQETLHIKNFFSIADFQWDVKGFNVLTGGMASGKSLCMKLLYFCEQIFHMTIFLEPTFSEQTLGRTSFFDSVRTKFLTIFSSSSPDLDFSETIIEYAYSYNGVTFDLSAQFDPIEHDLVWHSDYISNRLEQWHSFFVNNTPDMVESVQNRIYKAILNDFNDIFPFGTMFIPASRAITAISNSVDFSDFFLSDFARRLKQFVLKFKNFSSEQVNVILHIKNMSYENVDKRLDIELNNGRIISPLLLSSGQQELLYLLLLLDHLLDTKFLYGKGISVFIEEPSAHLFPLEQKQTLEFIIKTFKGLQNQKKICRFFISTHSPYILNVFNNILNKGRLQERIEVITDSPVKAERQAKLDVLSFPHLSVTDVSAYMIESSGHVKPMITGRKDDEYLYSEVLEQITQDINAETDVLYELGKEMRRYEKGKEK
jgi:AAA15 family ATPase/GTPase